MVLINHQSHATDTLEFLYLFNSNISTATAIETDAITPRTICNNIFTAADRVQLPTSTNNHQKRNTSVSSFQSSDLPYNLQQVVNHKQHNNRQRRLHIVINICERIMNSISLLGPSHRQHQRRRIDADITTLIQPMENCNVSKAIVAERRMNQQKHHHATRFYRFRRIFPYDIMCQIFNKLELRDLLKSTRVCSEWYRFLMEWPVFWKQLSLEMPQIDKPTFDKKVMRWRLQEFRVVGPMDVHLMRDMLMFLASSDNYCVQTLYFRKLNLKEDQDVNLLVQVLERSSSVTKRVEFVDCFLPKDRVFYPILAVCSNLLHVSFSKTTLTRTTFGIKRPTIKWNNSIPMVRNTITATSFYFLTFLKLCFEETGVLHVSTSQFSFGILPNCPNLTHLFLDSGGSLHQGHCIRQAIRYCPWLSNLIISDKAVMPATVISNISDDEYNTTKNSFSSDKSIRTQSSIIAALPKKGRLRRFVLTGGPPEYDRKDIISMYNSCYRSLELLYLHYDGSKIGSALLSKFANRGTATCLREIRLSTENMAVVSGKGVSTGKELAALLSQCPSLEVLKVIDTFSTRHNPSHHDYIYVDDHVLRTLANSCPSLRYFQVFGRRHYTVDALLYFANIMNDLAHLEMDIDRKIILTLVETLPSLKYLNVRKDQYYPEPPMSTSDKAAVKRILAGRGGMLTVVV